MQKTQAAPLRISRTLPLSKSTGLSLGGGLILAFGLKLWAHGGTIAADFSKAVAVDVAPLFRLLALAGLAGVLTWLRWQLDEMAAGYASTKWWDICARPRADASWDEIFDLLRADDASDPIRRAYTPKRRLDARAPILVFHALAFGIGIGGAIALGYILFPHTPILVVYPAEGTAPGTIGALLQASQNLTAYLALIAAAISIVFTYQQLRAKVRAASRQKWINKVRELIAQILSDIITKLAAKYSNAPKMKEDDLRDLETRLTKNRVHLELMLNPSERDHRLLCLLIRALALTFPISVDADCFVAQETKDIWRALPQKNGLRFILENLAHKKPLPPPPDIEADIISQMVKLSHILLKREWEQVRHIR